MNIDTIYNNSPYFVQNLMCSVKGVFIKRQRFNDLFYDNLARLEESQYWSTDDILRYKEERLYRMLEYAYQFVPFYKNYYDSYHVSPKDYKSLEDIEKFPVLTKELIRAHYKEMISTQYPRENLIHNHTSGSTGKALDFYQTKESLPYVWAIWWRLRNRFGVEYGDKSLNFTGKLVVPISTRRPPYWRVNKPMNQWLVNMQHMTKDKVQSIVEMINSEHFVFFSGYPSIIYAFALLVEENGLSITAQPKAIFTGAEKMYENQKTVLRRVFPGTIITDHYGTSEGVVNASKCETGVYHEDFELGHIECKEPHWISDTEYEGNILGTCFQNNGMPFIRYEIGDSAVWSSKKCSCGLHSQVIKDIQGRTEDYVITPEGLKVQRFDYLFKDMTSIKECQVVQRKMGEVIFRIVRRDNYDIKCEEELKKLVKEYISPTIHCSFEYVGEIERTRAGKFKSVASLINNKQL